MEQFDGPLPKIGKVKSNDGSTLYNAPQEAPVEEAPAAEEAPVEETTEEAEVEKPQEEENEETTETEEEGEQEGPVAEGEEGEVEASSEDVEEDDPFAEEAKEDPLEINGIDFNEVTGGLAQDTDELREIFNILNDPYMKQAFEYFKAEGTLEPYALAQTYSSDEYWNSISDFDVLANELKEQYKAEGMTDEEIELLVEGDMIAYEVDDENTDSENAKRKARLKLKANQARKKYKEEAKKYLSPQTRDEKEDQPSPELVEQQRIQTENRVKSSLKKQIANKQVSFKVGEADVKLNVAPRALLEMGMSQQKVIQSLFTKDGELDAMKLSFLSDPDSFMAAVQNSVSAEATKDFVNKNLKNSTPKGKAVTKKPESKESRLDANGLPPISTWKIKN